MYDKLVKNVNAINTSKLVNKIDYNANLKDIKDKIPIINTLATTAALTVVENQILDVSGLVKETDYDEKIKGFENKYFTTSDYNKFMNNILDAKIKNTKLVNKYDIFGFINNNSNIFR